MVFILFLELRDLTLALNDLCLTDAFFPELPGFYAGKVRDSYDLPDGTRIMIATDRQSAFDKVMASVPFKGQVLNQTARFWFEQTADLCPNHAVAYPDPNIVVAEKLDMLPVEMVVRDYLTGSTETSVWPMYAKGGRELYGLKSPNGLNKNQKLPETILTPTTKAFQGEHDAPITPDEIIKNRLLTEGEWTELAAISHALFTRGKEIAAKNGLILVDTKYEFGVDGQGRITLADEIHTPDSSRYWIKSSYQARLESGEEPESLDKEFLRLWVSERCDPYRDPIPPIPEITLIDFSERYISLFETITGEKFLKPDEKLPIQQRIRQSLAAAFPDYFT